MLLYRILKYVDSRRECIYELGESSRLRRCSSYGA